MFQTCFFFMKPSKNTVLSIFLDCKNNSFILNCWKLHQKLSCLQNVWKWQDRLECIAKTQLPRFQKTPQNDAKSINKDGFARNYTNLKTRVSHGVYCEIEWSRVKRTAKKQRRIRKSNNKSNKCEIANDIFIICF